MTDPGTSPFGIHAVQSDTDVITCRQRGRQCAMALGMRKTEQALLSTAISELARNIVTYAGKGMVTFNRVEQGGRFGIEVIAADQGPGIANIDSAMQDGFSTGASLGLGLPGTKRIVDEFQLDSAPGEGTTVTIRKWV